MLGGSTKIDAKSGSLVPFWNALVTLQLVIKDVDGAPKWVIMTEFGFESGLCKHLNGCLVMAWPWRMVVYISMIAKSIWPQGFRDHILPSVFGMKQLGSALVL